MSAALLPFSPSVSTSVLPLSPSSSHSAAPGFFLSFPDSFLLLPALVLRKATAPPVLRRLGCRCYKTARGDASLRREASSAGELKRRGGGMLLREPNQHLWEVFMGRQEDESENPLGCWCLKGPRFKGQSSPITEMRIIWFGEPELVRLSSWPVGCVYLPEAALAQDHEEVEVVDPHSDWDRDGDVERRAGWGGGGLGQNRGEGLRQRDRHGLRQRGGRHIWLGLLENSSGRTGR